MGTLRSPTQGPILDTYRNKIFRQLIISRRAVPTPEQVIELQGESTPHSRPDAGPWTVLATARDASEFCQAWLRLQCEQVAGATAALLLLDDGEGHFSSVAGWPDAHQDL